MVCAYMGCLLPAEGTSAAGSGLYLGGEQEMSKSRVPRRRRIAAVAAPATAIALLLGACGSSGGGGSASGGNGGNASSSGTSSSGGSTASNSAGGVSFTYGYYGNAEELAVYKKAVQLYEKQHPNVHISTQFNAPAQFLAKLPLQLRAGTQPDVVNVAESWVSLLQSTFHDFVDLTPYLKKDNVTQSSFVPGTWAPGALDGQQLMLPNIVYGDAVAINENLFKKDGIPLPGKNWTSSELLADAKKATAGSGSSKVWGLGAPRPGQHAAAVWRRPFQRQDQQDDGHRPSGRKGDQVGGRPGPVGQGDACR